MFKSQHKQLNEDLRVEQKLKRYCIKKNRNSDKNTTSDKPIYTLFPIIILVWSPHPKGIKEIQRYAKNVYKNYYTYKRKSKKKTLRAKHSRSHTRPPR